MFKIMLLLVTGRKNVFLKFVFLAFELFSYMEDRSYQNTRDRERERIFCKHPNVIDDVVMVAEGSALK